MGLEASFIGRQDTFAQMGPLRLSARLRIWSSRGFDVGAFGEGALNVLSAEELRDSPIGRDVGTAGLSLRKEIRNIYVENFVSLSTSGSAQQKLGQINYKHEFGKTIGVAVHAGAKLRRFRLGGYGELNLADYYRVSGGAFSFDTGRYRILSVGPEVSYDWDDFEVSVIGRFLANATRDISYDALGNIMGQGAGQGNVAATFSVKF
jgi:hypothetical protein